MYSFETRLCRDAEEDVVWVHMFGVKTLGLRDILIIAIYFMFTNISLNPKNVQFNTPFHHTHTHNIVPSFRLYSVLAGVFFSLFFFIQILSFSVGYMSSVYTQAE